MLRTRGANISVWGMKGANRELEVGSSPVNGQYQYGTSSRFGCLVTQTQPLGIGSSLLLINRFLDARARMVKHRIYDSRLRFRLAALALVVSKHPSLASGDGFEKKV